MVASGYRYIAQGTLCRQENDLIGLRRLPVAERPRGHGARPTGRTHQMHNPNRRSAMRLVIMALVLGLGARLGSAQVVERPVPFDSAGQVMTMSVPLAARLHLAPPAWPVTGNYMEVRLFDRGDGRFVLSV